MALIDKASLLMVPSTYEAGKLYNVLPSGNRAPDNKGGAGYDQTRADFDFDRGSNAAASRINSSGLIEKYRENLLLQSNNFGTTWAVSGTTLTSGQIGYDGSSDAWLLTKTASAFRYLYQNISLSGVQSFSVYAKAGSLNIATLYINATSNYYIKFSLVDGSVIEQSNTGAIINTNAEDVGNGWYRLSATISDSITRVRIYPDFTETTAGTILIQDAQLESGLCSTDYLNSTSVTAKAGVLIDLPRINYDANGENGALLLEPSRQQLLQYSEYFGTWTNDTNTSLTANAIKSPSGFADAYKMRAGTATARQARTLSVAATGNLVFSIYAKKGEYSVLQFTDAVDGNLYANFDLENGVLGNYNSCIPSVENAGDGWYRCVIYWNATQPNINKVRVSIAESKTQARLVNFAGNGTDGLYLFGAMLEQNASYQSSYIPNHGTSGGVTRAADSCSVTGVSDVIGQTEGTLFAQVGEFPKENNGRIFGISDGSTNKYIIIIKNSTNTDFAVYVTNNGGQVTYQGTGSLNDNSKIAVGYANNDYVIYVNGTQVHTDTSASVPTCSNIYVGQRENGSVTYIAGGSVKQATLFNERLTNAELATLTTL